MGVDQQKTADTVGWICMQDESVKGSEWNNMALSVDGGIRPRKTDSVLLYGVEPWYESFEILFYQESGKMWQMVVDVEYQKSFRELKHEFKYST